TGPVMQLVLFAWLLVRFAVAAAITAAFGTLVLLLWFGFTMPEPDEGTAKADAIVVLTGGEARIEVGYELLQKGLANRMFITGVGERVTKPQLLARLGGASAELAARIELGFRAANTIGNANETAAWFNSQNLKSMRLVTSNYHMRRSLLLFGRAMPNARILAHPVIPRGLGNSEWWTHRHGVEVVAHEMAKYFATLFHIPVD
ncbi:MAG: YdcF family protein, partial [Alphaproteobacteria bacterium]